MNIKDIVTKEGLLDKKKILDGKPLGLKALLGPAIDYANSVDEHPKDGKPDMIKYLAIAIKFWTIFMVIAPYISVPKCITWVVKHDWVTEPDTVEAQLHEAVASVAEIKALPVKNP